MKTDQKAPDAAGTVEAAGAKRNFILQQGLCEPAAATCPLQYSALLFQPRVFAGIILIATIWREPPVFLALGTLLWWNALVPGLNPFDAIYNRTAARRPGGISLGPAAAPRRFSQGMAGTFALAIGACYWLGWPTAALVLNLSMLAAIATLIFGNLCLGSIVYHVLRGRADFAKATLPWARDP